MQDIFKAEHNIREVTKEMVLLEDHLRNPSLECDDCIQKHMLKVEALLDEALSLTGKEKFKWIARFAQQWRNWQRLWVQGRIDNAELADWIRKYRKNFQPVAFDPKWFRLARRIMASRSEGRVLYHVGHLPTSEEMTLTSNPEYMGRGSKPVYAFRVPMRVIRALRGEFMGDGFFLHVPEEMWGELKLLGKTSIFSRGERRGPVQCKLPQKIKDLAERKLMDAILAYKLLYRKRQLTRDEMREWRLYIQKLRDNITRDYVGWDTLRERFDLRTDENLPPEK